MKKNAKKRPRGKVFSSSYQPPNENKKVKKTKTILKESIGLESWESVQNYLTKKGAAKFISEIRKLTGRSFCINFLQAMEYFKPKLSRTELTGKENTPLIPESISNLTFEQLLQLAQATAPNNIAKDNSG